ncbi:MAG TPA: 2-C-methyl-D-erythritol 4-phosphate cytidylyltransferase [Bacteroidales bacterium]|jgi:2-C-methyl-D-erythritol 4-phosphate cytidylyltransferase|nr:2-C-methyl-D-erythritol 4-phosphate cytidylyltransferase [Bacteroidales bacterium]
MKKAAILVAGGLGKRMNYALPKQFLELKGKPILFYTLETFYAYNPEMEIIVVLPEVYFIFWKELLISHKIEIPHKLAAGGDSRYQSVKNGLSKIENATVVAIHDGVRPFITPLFIEKLFEEAEKFGSAVPIKPVTETVRKINNEHNDVLPRQEIFLVQTPQIFMKDWLDKAYNIPFSESITDDAMLIEQAGFPLHFSEGLNYNIKITTPEDLKWAEKQI